MSGQRHPEEFKIEAVKQVTERGHSVADVADRLGVTSHRIYNWLKKYCQKAADHQANSEEAKKIKALEKELKRVTEETSYEPSSPYSASKAASDHLVRAWHRIYQLPVVLTNCSNNSGPYHFPE